MNVPTAELHVHLEGTLEPELIFALAERNGLVLSSADVEELRSRYRFSDLRSFLRLYYDNMAVLRTAADFADMTRAYLARARQAGVRHAEVFVDPQAHMARQVPLSEVMAGVTDALAASEREFGLSSGLIVTFLRDLPVPDAMDTLEEVLRLGFPILGVGLDSAEVGHPPGPFSDVFARARSEGLACVAHAGEEGPPSYIWEALDVLGATRIDHGVRCLEDDRLVERLVDERIPLTVCPLSNVALQVVGSMAEHPLPAMLRRGLIVTVNSDDPAYFGGYVDDNYAALVEELELDRSQIAALARNSVAASLLARPAQDRLLEEISAWGAGGTAGRDVTAV
jgi:adenosine deaminase